MTDLFERRPKKEQLKDWILSRNFTPTHQIIMWGLQNYHNRALRDAQQMAAEGLFRRMTDPEQGFYFPKSKEWVYVRNDFK